MSTFLLVDTMNSSLWGLTDNLFIGWYLIWIYKLFIINFTDCLKHNVFASAANLTFVKNCFFIAQTWFINVLIITIKLIKTSMNGGMRFFSFFYKYVASAPKSWTSLNLYLGNTSQVIDIPVKWGAWPFSGNRANFSFIREFYIS